MIYLNYEIDTSNFQDACTDKKANKYWAKKKYYSTLFAFFFLSFKNKVYHAVCVYCQRTFFFKEFHHISIGFFSIISKQPVRDVSY